LSEVADLWLEWLPEPAHSQFKRYGFYDMDIKLGTGTVKVVSVNTQACYTYNFGTMN
jgi:hypothetical protein